MNWWVYDAIDLMFVKSNADCISPCNVLALNALPCHLYIAALRGHDSMWPPVRDLQVHYGISCRGSASLQPATKAMFLRKGDPSSDPMSNSTALFTDLYSISREQRCCTDIDATSN